MWVLHAIRDHYAVLLIGTLVVPSLVFWWRWTIGRPVDPPKRKHLFFIVALVSAVILWIFNDVYNGIVTVPKKQGPNLRCEYIGHVISVGSSSATVELKVVNVGDTSSIVWKWQLLAQMPSGMSEEASATEDPVNLTMFSAVTTNQHSLFNTNYLPNGLLETPLGQGAGKKGWAMFVFHALSGDDLQENAVRFRLRFEDFQGKQTSILFTNLTKGRLY